MPEEQTEKVIPETMEISASVRGFVFIHGEHYPPMVDESGKPKTTRLLSESSVIGDYEDSMDNPGSSSLWFGNDLHLNREKVEFAAKAMQFWLKHKRLPYREQELIEDRIILDSELKEES